MARTRTAPQGRGRSSTPAHSLTIKNQPSTAQRRKHQYFKRQRRWMAFAAHRQKRSEWAERALDTQRIILGNGKYITKHLSTYCPPLVAQSPFQSALPVIVENPQGSELPRVVQSFYDIGPQVFIGRQGTTFYPHDSPFLANWRERRTSTPTSEPTIIRFVSQSTLTAARHLVSESPQFTTLRPEAYPTSYVGVLSFASAKRPGGGFLHGGDEQEETLARSTSLVTSLSSAQANEFYRTHRMFSKAGGAGLHDHSMVYSPGVVAFRRDDDDDIDIDWAPSPSSDSTIPPYLINVLSSVPVNAAAVRQNFHLTSSDAHIFQDCTIRTIMRDRMARALRIFEIRGDRALVLGAFGCGSSQNSVEMVAELWAELLVCGTHKEAGTDEEETRQARFKGAFEQVVFAVPGKLFSQFKRAFEMKVFEIELTLALIEDRESSSVA